MTMPHLENCRHSETGWCLDCVGEEHRKHAETIQRLIEHAAVKMYSAREKAIESEAEGDARLAAFWRGRVSAFVFMADLLAEAAK